MLMSILNFDKKKSHSYSIATHYFKLQHKDYGNNQTEYTEYIPVYTFMAKGSYIIIIKFFF